MNALSRLSSKGQLVVPKTVRDRHGWKAGDTIELVDSGAGVMLRSLPTANADNKADAIFAKIAAMVSAARIERIDDTQAEAEAAALLAAADQHTRSSGS